MEYLIEGATDIGNVKGVNQDSFMGKVIDTNQGKVAFAILCDGMGGLKFGEIASASVVQAYNEWLEHNFKYLSEWQIQEEDIRSSMTNLAIQFNEKIKAYGRERGISIGTTLTAILMLSDKYYIVHVGDTRIYEIDQNICQLTKDQTLVQREIDMGRLTYEQAKTDPRSSILLQCIGASDTVYPDFITGTTRDNCTYLLCSDGFRHKLSDEEIGFYLQPGNLLNTVMIEDSLKNLIELNKQRQETDNITAIVIRTYN